MTSRARRAGIFQHLAERVIDAGARIRVNTTALDPVLDGCRQYELQAAPPFSEDIVFHSAWSRSTARLPSTWVTKAKWKTTSRSASARRMQQRGASDASRHQEEVRAYAGKQLMDSGHRTCGTCQRRC